MNVQGHTRSCRMGGREPESPKSQGCTLSPHDFPKAVILHFEPWPIWNPENSGSEQIQGLFQHHCVRIKRHLISGILQMSTEMHCTKGTEHCPSIPLTMGDSHSENRAELTKGKC